MARISYHPLSSFNEEIRLLTIQPWRRRPDESRSNSAASAGHEATPLEQQGQPAGRESKTAGTDAGDDEDDIVCTLQTVSLASHASHPPYIALSYVWGDPTLSETIILDGEKTSITSNLKVALSALRDDQKSLVLWVDALCINQADLAEKSVQVGMMHRIYSQAASVNVWLGPADRGSDTVMSTLARIGGDALAAGILELRGEEYSKMRRAHEAGAPPLEPWLVENRDALDALSDTIGSSLPNSELDFFGRRPYWYRVWIMQEFVVARQLTLICGTMSLCYECFAAAILFESWHRVRRNRLRDEERVQHGGGFQGGQVEPVGAPRMIMTLIGARRRWLGQLGKPRDTLLELLMRTCLRQGYEPKRRASDIKDIVYGLVSMAADREELGIDIDYHKSVEEVYTDAARALLQRGYLTILAWNDPGTLKAVPNLPSWVPDFSTPMRDVCGEHRDCKLYTAGGGGTALVPSSFPPPSSPSLGLTPLTLTCYPLAIIGDIVNPWSTDNVFDGKSTGPYFRAIEIALSLRGEPPAGSPLLRQTPERRAEAVWRIPTGDVAYSRDRTRAARELHASYQEVRAVMGDSPPVDDPGWTAFTAGVENLSHDALMYCIGLTYHESRKVFISADRQYVGLVPSGAEKDHLVAVVKGAHVPYVFRRDEGRAGWELIGEAYVDGIMDGELLESSAVEPLELVIY